MADSKRGIKINVDEFISAAKLDENWGLTVLSAKQVRAVVKVETNKGTYALKKVDYSPEKLNFIYEAQEHLWKNGFQNQSRWLVTKSGKPFFEIDNGQYYYLNNWINGMESDIKELDQLIEMMELQATLHRSSLGFTPSSNAEINSKWEVLESDFESDIAKLRNLYKQVKIGPETDIALAYLKTAEKAIRMAETGLELLKASAYKEVLNQAIDEMGFVHGDFVYHNFIRSDEGKMHVIDFDFCVQNLRVRDLAVFLMSLMHRADWDVVLNEKILKAYHKVYPLTEEELKILKAIMHFPKHYWRVVMRGFITERYTSKKTIRKLRKESKKLMKLQKYLDSFPLRLS